MLLVYSEMLTMPNRLHYAVKILANIMGINSYEITSDIQAFTAAKEVVKINYSNTEINNEALWIKPHGLLFETVIQQQQIDIISEGKDLYFFSTAGAFPFDVFAATFYLVSRYEEYLPHQKDIYNRFAHTESIAFKHQFLQIPLVNFWAKKLKEHLIQNGFEWHSVATNFQFIPTYDVDIAFQYKAQPWYKIILSASRQIAKGNLGVVNEIFGVLSNTKSDAFDVFSWLAQLHTQHKLKPIYFYLLAKKRSRYDKNNDRNSKALQQFIYQQSVENFSGIHPSYQAATANNLLKDETIFLEKIIKKKVTKSRHHYVKITLPETYESLQQLSITADYSMGYGSINGFRASICTPYNWYNLATETATQLTIFPFCFMDANSHFEQHFSAKQAAEELQGYYNICKEVNGICITIFHNHFLVNNAYWQNWRTMYANFLDKNLR